MQPDDPDLEGADSGDPWSALEADLEAAMPSRFIEGSAGVTDLQKSTFRLDDVGGMHAVKRRLRLSFLAPIQQPELSKLFGKNPRGGLLLYGPPGCGKTYIAKALAGEMDGHFVTVSIADVLSMWSGTSEQNLHDIFQSARRKTPCVVFMDELDALGHRRSSLSGSGMRTLINQLLMELDGLDSNNDGVFVLGATNAPWDVDAALRRPGRFDRMLFVPPPDDAARKVILESQLEERPIDGVDLDRLVARTARFSGADLAHLCDSAAEFTLEDSVETGEVRSISQLDFESALEEIRPSTSAWLATARNVAVFANAAGDYNDLADYLGVAEHRR